MAQVKLVWLLCDFFGIPITILGIAANIDNVKSIILFILSIIYLMMRGYFYMVKSNQSVRKEELDIWHKEQDKIDRMNKTNIK